jgi:hypothetical protein
MLMILTTHNLKLTTLYNEKDKNNIGKKPD